LGAGTALGVRSYEAPGHTYDSASAIAVDRNGDVVVTGRSGAWYATIKYSGAGVPLWTNLYKGPVGTSEAAAIAVDGAGTVFVTGSSDDANYLDDYATVAYSAAGVPLWTNRYHGPGNGHYAAKDIAVDGGGSVLV